MSKIALQMLILTAVGLQIRPNRELSVVGHSSGDSLATGA